MEPITLPGTIPNLLRRGSPVILDGHEDIPADSRGRAGLVFNALASIAYVAVHGMREDDYVALESLVLDLTDATGRAHAAWWLTGRTDVDTPRVVSPVYFDHTGIPQRYPGACLHGDWSVWSDVVAHLDPNDPRLLPDGSRWVDAEALRLVVLHVAGVVS